MRDALPLPSNGTAFQGVELGTHFLVRISVSAVIHQQLFQRMLRRQRDVLSTVQAVLLLDSLRRAGNPFRIFESNCLYTSSRSARSHAEVGR
jgi:hypothetical protein